MSANWRGCVGVPSVGADQALDRIENVCSRAKSTAAAKSAALSTVTASTAARGRCSRYATPCSLNQASIRAHASFASSAR